MGIVNSIIEKLNDLESQLKKIDNERSDELEALETQESIIDKCEEILKSGSIVGDGKENELLTYDFTSAYELLKSYDFSIQNLLDVIKEIKVAVSVMMDLNLPADIFVFEEKQIVTINSFIESLNQIKKIIEQKKSQIALSEETKETLTKRKDLLEKLKSMYITPENHYCTEEMFDAMIDELDVENMSLADTIEFVRPLDRLKNFGSKPETKCSVNEIVDFYKIYLNERDVKRITSIIEKYKDEVVENFNLDSSRKIMDFFKEKGLINKFRTKAILEISLYGEPEYIENVIYPKVMSCDKRKANEYFLEVSTSRWVIKNGDKKSIKFGFKNIKPKFHSGVSLYSECHKASDEECEKNIKLLVDNKDLFADKIDFDEPGSNLRIKNTSHWILKKNIELCRLFGLGSYFPVFPTCISVGTLEDRINIAIELGLLNSPLSDYFRDIDSQIVKSGDYQLISKKKNLNNQTIRNYFMRSSTRLASFSYDEFMFLAHYLQENGYVNFYNSFLSDMRAGQASLAFFEEIVNPCTQDQDKMEQIKKDFVDFNKEIPDFERYSKYIDSYVSPEITPEYGLTSYIDNKIFENPFIRELEENNRVNDVIDRDGQEVVVPNEYVYIFNGKLISRYKVLHNASILYSLENGQLNEDMIITCICNNSFIDRNAFLKIKQTVSKGESEIKWTI